MLGDANPVDEQSLRQIYTAIALHALLTHPGTPLTGAGTWAVTVADEVVQALKETARGS